MDSQPETFYVTGGTVGPVAPSYVTRKADADLHDALTRGDFCYVLTSRQMGKSSLAVRATDRLIEDGATVATLDLSIIGSNNVTPEQWYNSLLARLGEELDLDAELTRAWKAHPERSPVLRWWHALRDVALDRIPGRLTLFIDEIDAVRSLPFATDEFFAALRACHNERARDSRWERLTVCLLGVASPSDLIQDPRTTPFNIGQRIELADFTAEEAAPLANGLGLRRDPDRARRLLDRILHWTAGHPYLTQRLCRAVAEDPTAQGSSDVDRHCRSLFLDPRARERDDNLLFVRDRLLRATDPDQPAHNSALDLYDRVRRRQRVPDREADPRVEALRLSGVTRVDDGLLRVRNRIYVHVFTPAWVAARRPPDLQRIRRRAAARGAFLATALLAPPLAAAAWYWDQRLRHVEQYFAHIVMRDGAPEGVYPLTSAQVRRRAVSLKLLRNGRAGPVRELQAIDAQGHLTARNPLGSAYLSGLVPSRQNSGITPECRWQYIRDSDGHVVFEKAFDVHGRLVWNFLYTQSPQQTATATNDNGKNQAKANAGPPTVEFTGVHIDERGYVTKAPGTRAAYVKFQRFASGPQRGRDHIVRYYDAESQPQPDHDGAYGELRDFDGPGPVTRITYLGPDGRPTWLPEGVAGQTFQRDTRGNIDRTTYFGPDGRASRHNDGFVVIQRTYDDRDNPREFTYLDEAGRLTPDNDGCARWTADYDDLGRRIAVAFFAPNGRRIAHPDGYAALRSTYDERGNKTADAYLGPDGRPTRQKRGYASARYTCDLRGNQINVAYFDEAGHPTHDANGIARWTAEYDDHDRRTLLTTFDLAGQPTPDANGRTSTRSRYDERGNPIEEAYLNEHGRHTPDNDGVARWTATYDDLGQRTLQTFFDAAGAPTLGPEGSAAIADRHDDQGRLCPFREPQMSSDRGSSGTFNLQPLCDRSLVGSGWPISSTS